ncbi:recombinase family protein [Patescibacteria group bacterium]|nr:recombinase family protein [Patescibacteria group bacterium]
MNRKEIFSLFNLPPSNRTIDDLANYFTRVESSSNRILPKEKRRYVIYLRKSTDDEAKQVRSLPDQRIECLALAQGLDIKVREEDIFEESASAKISGNRPIFEGILNGFLVGKYHGLIAWSPDRLSRNMKEAGEIIEMIDHEQIQDLLFKTYQFDNTPNGKMLLGILFATSKQYSDKLSVDVNRGNTGLVREGKYIGTIKKGYCVDRDTGYFTPDGDNWELLRKAVNMKLYKGKSNIEIVDFLRGKLHKRKDLDSENKIVQVDKNSVPKMFGDPFYFGLYRYGKHFVDLTEIYNFLPLITPDEYIKLNPKTAFNFGEYSFAKKASPNKLGYGYLRGKVICDYCDSVMQFQHQEIKRGENKGKWVISFYCRNKDCQRHKDKKLKKSIRAKYISAHIGYILRNCMKKNKEAYKLYKDRLKLKLAENRGIAERKLREAKSDLKMSEQRYFKYQEFQVNDPEGYKRHHSGKLEQLLNTMEIARHNIQSNKDKLSELNKGLPTEEKFYELIKSYLVKLRQPKDMIEEDIIYNELVSNLRAGDDSISVVEFNSPYNLMVDLDKIITGRGERI